MEAAPQLPMSVVLVRPGEKHLAEHGMGKGWTAEEILRARAVLAQVRVVGTDPVEPTMAAVADYLQQAGISFESSMDSVRLGQVDDLVSQTGWTGPLAEFLEVPGLANIQINGAGQDVILEYASGQRDVVRGAQISQAWAEYLVTCWLGSRRSGLISALRLPGVVHGSLGGMRFTYFGPEHARRGMTLQIRMPLARPSLAELAERGLLTWDAVQWLRALVRARCNLLVSGGTNAGKTTLVGALLGEIDPMERVGVIEAFAELNIDDRPGTVAYELGPDGNEEDLAKLVHGNLYNSVERLVLGEARGSEAAQLLLAMNSGVAGCIATIHADSAEDAPRRLAQCARLSPSMASLPAPDLYRMIAGLGLIVVHVELTAGDQGPRRRVTQMVEIDDVLDTTFRRFELFHLSPAGELVWVGPSPSPRLWKRLQARGITGLPMPTEHTGKRPGRHGK